MSKNSVNFLEKWKPIGIIGTGSTCDVILIQDIETQEKKVVKLYKSKVKSAVAEAEAQLLMSLNHPRILSASSYLPNVFVPLADNEYPIGGELESLSAVTLEYAPNGDFLGLMQSVGSFSEEATRKYFVQLIDALEYLHEKEICHLDIKPDNILVDEDYNLKLADFGVSMSIPKDCYAKGKVGTAPYHSPEMHLNRPYKAHQADLFALGITLFMMVIGNMPFNAAKASDPLFKLIIEENFETFWTYHESIKENNGLVVSEDFKSLIQSMFAFNANRRLTLEQIKQHAWVKSKYDEETQKTPVTCLKDE